MDESARQLKRLAHISRFVRIHIGVGQRCYAIDAESSTLPGKASAALVTFQRGDGGNVADGSKCKHSHTAVPKSRARAQQSVSSRVSSMGQWMMTVQGMFKRQTNSPIILRTHKAAYSQFSGAMEESSGQVQAHPRSGVVMDTAAFKVSHSVVSNRDATALRAVIARSSSIGAMERYMRGFNSAQNSRSPAKTHRQQ